MGGCLECFKINAKNNESTDDNGIVLSTTTNSSVVCKAGKAGDTLKMSNHESRNSYCISGSGIFLGSCALDCDTAFWEVVVGKHPEGIKIGVKRFSPKHPCPLTGTLDDKSGADAPSWFLDGVELKENDVIGVCWDQTDLPMLSFTKNGELLNAGSINRIRPANDIYPAVSIQPNSTCEVIFDGQHFLKSPPSSKFKMIVCATSLI